MTLSWNLVARHLHPHAQLEAKLRQKIVKMEQHLQKFPPEAVHLQVVLDRHPSRLRLTASLTLKLPSNILHVTKGSSDPISAFDQAVKVLLRKLGNLKSDLRRESSWGRTDQARPARPPRVRFAPRPTRGGAEPQSLGDMVRSLVERFTPGLLEDVRRQLSRDAADGRVPRDAIDAEAVVDEVVQQVLSDPAAKPDELGYRAWLFRAAREELRRRYRRLQEEARLTVSLDDLEPAEGSLPGEPTDQSGLTGMAEETFEPAVLNARETLPDASAPPPDWVLAHQEFLGYVHDVAAKWPKAERDVLELYFIEGFEPDEVAMIEGISLKEAQHLIDQVGGGLREMFRAAATAAPARAPVAMPRASAARPSGRLRRSQG